MSNAGSCSGGERYSGGGNGNCGKGSKTDSATVASAITVLLHGGRVAGNTRPLSGSGSGGCRGGLVVCDNAERGCSQ
eukprot:2091729-Prorocentrum_lima.AAC.1